MDRMQLSSELMRLGLQAHADSVFIDGSDLKNCGIIPTDHPTKDNPYPRASHVGVILCCIAEQLDMDEREGVTYDEITKY